MAKKRPCSWRSACLTGLGVAAAFLLAAPAFAQAQADPLVQKTVQIAENMEPVIPHPAQEAEAAKKAWFRSPISIIF